MKIIDHKDAINRRLYEGLMIVETPIYRVSSLNRTLLRVVYSIHMKTAVSGINNNQFPIPHSQFSNSPLVRHHSIPTYRQCCDRRGMLPVRLDWFYPKRSPH
jgi:hypothetical protein